MRLAASILRIVVAAAAVTGCDEEVDNPVIITDPTPVASTPAPTPTPAPTAVYTTRRESVTFPSGSLEVHGSLFDVGVRGTVEVQVGCHMSFVPIQLVKVDLLAGGSQRVASQRCGAAFPTCADVAFTVEADPGGYVVRLERDPRYRTWTGYMCDVAVTAP